MLRIYDALSLDDTGYEKLLPKEDLFHERYGMLGHELCRGELGTILNLM